MSGSLRLETSTQLSMTPQLQQSIRLLQLSATEFEQEIAAAMANNPFLENADEETSNGSPGSTTGDREQDLAAGDGAPTGPVEQVGDGNDTADDGASGGDTDDVTSAADSWPNGSQQARDGERADAAALSASSETLGEHLLQQIGSCRLAAVERLAVEVIVESLDDDGYLRQSFDDVLRIVPSHGGLTLQDLQFAHRFVQSLDPAGVGARSVSECLRLQLDRVAAEAEVRGLARRIVTDHLRLLAAHDWPRLAKAADCDQDALRAAYALIQRLDPRPGYRFSAPDTRYVVAEVMVRRVGNRWRAAINPQVLPRLHINEMYAQVLRDQRRGSHPQLGQQLQEARWLLRNINHRFRTILRVAEAIVEQQQSYFVHGELGMRPLLLRDIAQAVDLHESTVSRVTSNKYMATPRGVIELKRFFGSHTESESGYVHSPTAIRALIRTIIDREPTEAPLSDIKVTRILGARGVKVARRTVTKYRDAMRIPPVEVRRMNGS